VCFVGGAGDALGSIGVCEASWRSGGLLGGRPWWRWLDVRGLLSVVGVYIGGELLCGDLVGAGFEGE
jgi:hypothetical protein